LEVQIHEKDVLKCSTTDSGEPCVMMDLTTQRQELYAPHLDLGTFYIGVAQGMLLASPVGDDKVEANPACWYMAGGWAATEVDPPTMNCFLVVQMDTI